MVAAVTLSKLITSTSALGTLGPVASLLATILYQGNHDINHTPLREIYFMYKCCWKVAEDKWKVHNEKI